VYSPFEQAPLGPPPVPNELPIAVVVDDDEQAAAYLAAGPVPGGHVVVKTSADVPERLGGMAIVTERRLDEELQHALLVALGVAAEPQ
jgi:hypothetical protein